MVLLPNTLTNGLYQVRVVLADAAGSATNARTIQVVPLVATPIGVTVQVVGGQQVHQLSINGARLGGADLRLVVDGVVYEAGASANAALIVYTFGRLLDPGAHTLIVVLDGQASRTIGFSV